MEATETTEAKELTELTLPRKQAAIEVSGVHRGRLGDGDPTAARSETAVLELTELMEMTAGAVPAELKELKELRKRMEQIELTALMDVWRQRCRRS